MLHQWLPGGELEVQVAVARALTDSFPYVKAYVPFQGWGAHFLASMKPRDLSSATVLASRVPSSAAADLIEWGPGSTPEEQFALVLQHELPVSGLLASSPSTPALSDDRPFNEYFFLRANLAWLGGRPSKGAIARMPHVSCRFRPAPTTASAVTPP